MRVFVVSCLIVSDLAMWRLWCCMLFVALLLDIGLGGYIYSRE